MIAIINQVFDIAQKLGAKGETLADRNFARIYHELDNMGYHIVDPIGRKYQETDTDVEATLSGGLLGQLKVTRVLKPIIYKKTGDSEMVLLQKGIVIIEGE
jgi:hypothetical protein